METIDLVEKELAEMGDKETYTASPLLIGMAPYQYLVHSLRTAIKASEMESALLILPFHYVVRFIPMLAEVCRLQLDVELSTRCVIFLLRCHMPRIISTHALYADMLTLKAVLKSSVSSYLNVIGTNMAALNYMSTKIAENGEIAESLDEITKRKPSARNGPKSKRSKL